MNLYSKDGSIDLEKWALKRSPADYELPEKIVTDILSEREKLIYDGERYAIRAAYNYGFQRGKASLPGQDIRETGSGYSDRVQTTLNNILAEGCTVKEIQYIAGRRQGCITAKLETKDGHAIDVTFMDEEGSHEVQLNGPGYNEYLEEVDDTVKRLRSDLKIYSMNDWIADGGFKAEPGQEVTAEVYTKMFEASEPVSLSAEVTEMWGAVGGFCMDKSSGVDQDGAPLYMGFMIRDGLRYYIGLLKKQ